MLNKRKLALTLALVFAGIHVVWSLLVVVGWAQPLLDFVTWAHMMETHMVVGQFDLLAALTLVLVAAAIGWGLGTLFATVWNAQRK